MYKSIVIASLIILIPLSAVSEELKPLKPIGPASAPPAAVKPAEQPTFLDRVRQFLGDQPAVKEPDESEMSPLDPQFDDPSGSGPSVTAFGWEPIIQMTSDWSQFGYFYRKRMDTLPPSNLPASQVRPSRPTGEFGYEFEFVFCTQNCDYWNGTDEIFIRTYMVVELTGGTNATHYRYFPIDVIRATVEYDAEPLRYPAGENPSQQELYENSHVILKVEDLDRVNCFAEPFEIDQHDVPNIVALRNAWNACGSYGRQARGESDVATGLPIGAWSDYKGNLDLYGITPSINYNQHFITPYGVSEQGSAGNNTLLAYDITLDVYTNADNDIIVTDEGGKLKEFILNQTNLEDYLLYTNIFPTTVKFNASARLATIGKVKKPAASELPQPDISRVETQSAPPSNDLIWTFDHRMGWPTKIAPSVANNPTW